MMAQRPGWRSARSRQWESSRPVAGSVGAPEHAASDHGVLVSPGGAAMAAAPHAGAGAHALTGAPWRGVRWSLVLVGYLVYLFVILSYRLNIADVAMAAALVGIAVQGGPRVPTATKIFGVFILWCAIGYLPSAFPAVVGQQLVSLVKLWLIVVVAANALRERAQARFYIAFYIACFLAFPFRGTLFTYYLYHNSLFGGRAAWIHLFENPNDLAAIAILQLSMAAGLLVTERPRSALHLLGVVAAAAFPALILLTQSRGAFLAFATLVLLIVVTHRARIKLLLQIGVLGALLLAVTPDGVWTRVKGLRAATGGGERLEEVDREGSARQRYEIWKVARKMSREHPVTGVGTGAYSLGHEYYAMGSEFNPTARGRRDTHSMYLNVLAETGYPGLLLFLGVLVTTLLHAERVRRACRGVMPREARQLQLLVFGLLAFCQAAIFGSLAYLPFLHIHLALIWALAEICRRELAARGAAAVSAPMAARRFP